MSKKRMLSKLLHGFLLAVVCLSLVTTQASIEAYADVVGQVDEAGAEATQEPQVLTLGGGEQAEEESEEPSGEGFAPLADPDVIYYDGVYEGTGGGRNDDITVRVTIADGKIASVEEVYQVETASYWQQAKAIFDKIVEAQSYEIDDIAGASQSSRGIRQAVSSALRKAQTPPAGPFSSGAGTAADPFIVSTVEGLQKFATSVDEGETYAGKYIELGADLDLSGIDNWNPIGTEANATATTETIFAGSFDGAGHAISNLKIALTGQTTDLNVGLFSTLQRGASVSNVSLEGVDINVTSDSVIRAGAIAGDTVSGTAEAHATIDSCSATGSVSVDTSGAKLAFAGGMAGRMLICTTVANSWTDVTATAFSRGGNNSGYAGGIAGMAGNNTGIVNCVTFGNVYGVSPKSTNFGGMAGGLGGMLTAKAYNNYAMGAATAGNAGNGDTLWVGALAGQFIYVGGAEYPATGAWREYNYYPSDVQLAEETWTGDTFTSQTVEARGAGSGTSADAAFAPVAMDRSAMAAESFAATLNGNIRESLDLAAAYSLGIAKLNTWELKDGRVLPTGPAWVETEPDASIFDSGEGTAENPYKIRTEEQLRAFAGSLTEGIDYTDKYIEVIADIDVSSAPWVPVGNSEYAFNGTFDGGNFTISGMYLGTEDEPAAIESGAVFVGFFSVLAQDAVVKNVNLANVYYNITYPATIRLGGIAAYMQGSTGSTREGAQINNCSVTGKMNLTAEAGNVFAAGIAGYQFKGSIINSWTDVDINVVTKGSALAEGGGLVALNNRGLVANCYTLGDIYGSGNREDGNEGMASISSLVGVNGGDIANCYGAGGHTSAELSVYVGAVSGWVTGVGKSYNSFYNGEAPMQVGTQTVSPVESIGTKVPSGVSDEGDVYTGGVVDALAPYTAATYAGIADTLNANFAAFPIETSQYGLSGDVFKNWVHQDGLVTFGDQLNSTTYQQPEAEIVPVVEPELRDGIWYGRDADKASVVKITVEDGEVAAVEVVEGEADGDAFEAALAEAKEKAVYGDTTDYYDFDAAYFAGGTGTEDDPYLVATEDQLRYIAQRLNADNLWEGVSFRQTADIAMSADEWLPIGWGIQAEINNRATQYCAYPFLGNYDGGDFAVTGVTIGVDGQPTQDPRMQYVAGFFGFTTGEAAGNALPDEDDRVTKIANVHLKDIDVNVASRYNNYVGGLAGNLQNGFYVDNCSVEGKVSSTTEETTARAGGLVGNALRGQVTNSWTDVAVYAYDNAMAAYAGGLYALDNRTTTINCYTLGTTTCGAGNNNRINVGGLVGQAGGYYYNVYAHGNVVAENTTTFAGLVNGNFAGICIAKDVYYNTDAKLSIAGTAAEPVPNGRVVTDEEERVGFVAKTAEQMAADEFAKLLTGNIGDAEDSMATFAEIIENGSLASVLYYQGDGSDLLSWKIEGDHAVFGELPVNKDDLNEAIAAAQAAEKGAKTSTDGTDVDPASQWTTAAQKKALDDAIKAAQDVANDPAASQADVDAATETVKKATEDYNAAKKAGTKPAKQSWIRLKGTTAYDTMQSIVKEGWKQTGGTVIVATGEGFADALAAAGIAGLENAPILTTTKKSLSAQTRTELNRLKPKNVIIVGGRGAVSTDVENAIKGLSFKPAVTRHKGAEAFNTANAMNLAYKGKWSDTAILATSKGYADALSAAPIAYSQHMPIFLVKDKNTIDKETLDTMKSCGIKTVMVVGGRGVVSDDVRSKVAKAGFTVDTRKGASQYDTSLEVAKWGLSLGLSADMMGVATGRGYADALAGAALCGQNNAVLVLADKDNHKTCLPIASDSKAKIAYGYVYGGRGAVPADVQNAYEAASGCPKTTKW